MTFEKGFLPWNKGLTKKTDERIIGTKLSEKTKIKMSEAKKDKTYEELVGVEKSREWRKKQSEAKIGDKNPMKRPEVAAKAGKTISRVNKGNPKRCKENHWHWQNGKSFESYGEKFNDELKFRVRNRDKFICQFCGSEKGYFDGRAHPIHHINYKKKDNRERVLITLCVSCNAKAECDKEKWELCFTVLNEIRHLTYPIGGI